MENKALIDRILKEKSNEAHPVELLADLTAAYLNLLGQNRFPKGRDLSIMTPDEVTSFLKREKFDIGKYLKVSIFEAANRIATDLVLLGGLRMLIDEYHPSHFRVLFGHDAIDKHGDFALCIDGRWWEGEAFSTATSFFHPKLSKTKRAWESKVGANPLRFIIFNSDAHANPQNLTKGQWKCSIQDDKVAVLERFFSS